MRAHFTTTLMACLGGLVVAGGTAAQDWPGFRGPTGDGQVAALPKAVPAKKVLWEAKFTGECHAGLACAEGVLVVPDGNEEKDFYRAFDAESGKSLWVREFPNGKEMDYGPAPRATPLIRKGKVYVCSAFGDFYCLDLKDGKTLWQKSFEKDYKAGAEPPQWGYSSSPLIVGDKLLMNPGGKTAIVALNPETGAEIWRGAGGGVNYSTFIVSTFGGVEQAIGYDGGSLGGWAIADGKRLWKLPAQSTGGYIVPSPVKVGDKLVVSFEGGDTNIYGFGKDGVLNPKSLGTNEDLKPDVITPQAVDNLVLGVAAGLICLDAKDELKPLWTDDKERSWGGQFFIMNCGNQILTFNDRGEITLATVEAKGATVIGKVRLCGATQSHPAIANGKIYVRDKQGVYCCDLGMGGK